MDLHPPMLKVPEPRTPSVPRELSWGKHTTWPRGRGEGVGTPTPRGTAARLSGAAKPRCWHLVPPRRSPVQKPPSAREQREGGQQRPGGAETRGRSREAGKWPRLPAPDPSFHGTRGRLRVRAGAAGQAPVTSDPEQRGRGPRGRTRPARSGHSAPRPHGEGRDLRELQRACRPQHSRLDPRAVPAPKLAASA